MLADWRAPLSGFLTEHQAGNGLGGPGPALVASCCESGGHTPLGGLNGPRSPQLSRPGSLCFDLVILTAHAHIFTKGWLMHFCVWMLSHVQLFATPWTAAHQAPLSMGFSSLEHWSGLPFPPPGDLPDPGVGHASLASPALAGGFFIPEPPGNLEGMLSFFPPGPKGRLTHNSLHFLPSPNLQFV